jgi:hypothetical protein
VFIPNTVRLEELLKRATTESTWMSVYLDFHGLLHHPARRQLPGCAMLLLHRQRSGADQRPSVASALSYASGKRVDKAGERTRQQTLWKKAGQHGKRVLSMA